MFRKELIIIPLLIVMMLVGCKGKTTNVKANEYIVFQAGDVMAITEYENNIVIGGRDGVYEVNKTTKEINIISSKEITYVKSVFVDSNNNLWVASENGLYLLNQDSWQCFNSNNSSIPDDRVNTIFEDADSQLWIGTWGGISLFNNYEFNNNNSSNGLITDMVNVIDQSKDKTLWLGSYAVKDGGLSYGKLNSWKTVSVAEGLVHADITSILVNDNRVYIGAGMYDRGGLNIFEKNSEAWELKETITLESGLLAGAKVRSLFCDEDYLWVGSEYDGLSIINLKNSKSLVIKDSLPHPEIKAFYRDSHGSLWIGTRDGLVELNISDLQELYSKLK